MENSTISERAISILNLEQYNNNNNFDFIDSFENIKCPYNEQYILRCQIKDNLGNFHIPSSLLWLNDLLEAAKKHQEKIGINHSFCYITVRHGYVKSITDDEWHVDGFSTRISHIPEQNYIWTNIKPTEYVKKRFEFPKDFNPKKHNIQHYFQDNINENDKIYTFKENCLYCLDPYIIHKRPENTEGLFRTFIRISFTPIEIQDINNTLNPILPKPILPDGVKDFRDNLERYKI